MGNEPEAGSAPVPRGRLPNVLIVGAEKCGTTSVADMLGAHPDGFLCAYKEPHFFSDDDRWSRGLDWYASLYEGGEAAAVRCEGSVTISYHSRVGRAIPRIRQVLGDPLIVYVARHPVRRIESRWRMWQAFDEGGGAGPFEGFVRGNWEYLIRNSLYAERSAPFREAFSRVRTLFFEDLRADRGRFVRSLYEACGLDGSFTPPEIHSNRPKPVRERASVTRLRRTAAYRAVRGLLPGGLRSAVAAKARSGVDLSFEWPPALLREVEGAVRGDAARFLAANGKPADFWRFSDARPAGDGGAP